MIGAGMDMVQALAAQASGAGTQVVQGDLVLAYCRAARAVRMAMLLQSHLIAEPGARTAVAQPAAAREDRVAPTDEDPGRPEAERDENAERPERPERELAERLERDDIYRQVRTRPVIELVAEIANDLGLSPDWPQMPPEPGAEGECDEDPAFAPLRADPPRSPARAGAAAKPTDGTFRLDTG